jgi:hypothetical protein
MSVITDETGLHARECACLRCESGYRPTDRERELAWRVFREAQAARARLLASPVAAKPVARLSHTVRPMTPVPPPMSREELALLRADVERFKAGGGK